MTKPLGVALLGCGTVGGGVAELLLNHAERIAQRASRPVSLRRILVRDPNRSRPNNLPSSLFTTEFVSLHADHSIDVVVELVGGTDWAQQAVLNALDAGKHVVTANKALLAQHGGEIFRRAHERNRIVCFEASVAGGIPIIGALTSGLSANRIISLQGILNGTCNYILTAMTEHNLDYEAALAEAQAHGFAEADPTLDVNGSDAAHKLAILARLAFQMTVPVDLIQRRGIADVTPLDIRFAGELGYVFKLVAEAHQGNGALAMSVGPALVRRGTSLADIRGVDNAIRVVGDAVGEAFFSGPGAGRLPTASAVVADLIDIAVGRAQLTFESLRLWEPGTRLRLADFDEVVSRFYLRLMVADRPGVLAEISALLAMESISIASVIQHEAPEEDEASVALVILTHAAKAGRLRAALERIDASEHVREPARSFPVQ